MEDLTYTTSEIESYSIYGFRLTSIINYFFQKAGRIVLICLSAKPSSLAELTLAFWAAPFRFDCRSANQGFFFAPFEKTIIRNIYSQLLLRCIQTLVAAYAC